MKPVALTVNKVSNVLLCITSKNLLTKNKRAFSSSCLSKTSLQQKENFTIHSLDDFSIISSNRTHLAGKAGIYCFLNKISNKRYIGSAKNLYLRLTQHLSAKKSNSALQLAFGKYGLENFSFIVYEYCLYKDKALSHKLLTNLETTYIKAFPFEQLYNFMKTATSLEGYKHTLKAREKMVARLKDKANHPLYQKKHSEKAKKLISKPGQLNPMYGKSHSLETKKLISLSKISYPKGVNVFDSTDVFIGKFNSKIDIAKALNINKSTVTRYLKTGKLYLKEI